MHLDPVKARHFGVLGGADVIGNQAGDFGGFQGAGHRDFDRVGVRGRHAFGADGREVGAGARAELEEQHLPLNRRRDVHQVVLDRLDEARGELRAGISVTRELDLVGGRIPDPAAHRAPRDPVALGEPAVEPDRRIEGADLVHEHVGELGLEGLRFLGILEVAAEGLARLAQGARDPSHHLAHAPLAAGSGDTGLPEVLGDEDVGRELRPVGRHLARPHLEHDRAVGILDARVPLLEPHALEGIVPRPRETALQEAALLPLARPGRSGARTHDRRRRAGGRGGLDAGGGLSGSELGRRHGIQAHRGSSPRSHRARARSSGAGMAYSVRSIAEAIDRTRE